MYSYLCRFLSFPLFFLWLFRFLFLFSLSRRLRVLMAFFFFFFRSSVSFFRFPRPIISNFFFHQVSFILVTAPFVTLRPHPHTHSSSSRTFSSWPAGDQLVAEGVTHISLPLHKNTIGGTGENKTDGQTRTKLGVNQEQKEVLQHFISVCGVALAWVTSENSTSTGMPTSFDSIFFAGPYLVSSTVSGVRC